MIIYVPEDVMERLIIRLKETPEKMRGVLKKTINDTAVTARRELENKAQERYTIQKGALKKRMEIEKATARYLQATIHTEGRPLPLYGFKKRKNIEEVAAKAQAVLPGNLKELVVKGGQDNGKDLKAFVQTMKKSGHTGIFERMNRSERGKAGTQKRNAIKQLYGPSIPQMVGNEKKVYPIVQPIIAEELRKNLEKHIALVMEDMQ